VSEAAIAYHQRVLVLGETRSGKSELLNHLFSTLRCQRILLDTKGGEWGIPGVEAVHSVEEFDWTAPIIHFVTQTDDPMEIDPVFAIARERKRPISICAHEMGDLCNFNAQRTPPNVSSYISKGGAWGCGFMGGSQRPVEMPVRGKTEVQHVFVVVPPQGDNELAAIAGIGIGVSKTQLQEMLKRAQADHGEHSFIWFRKGYYEPLICKPLPEHLRNATIVRRKTPA
jgi:hypothetical protein